MDLSLDCPRAFESYLKPYLLVVVVVIEQEEEETDVSITSPSAPCDAASRGSCRLGQNVCWLSRLSRLFRRSVWPSDVFVGQGSDGEM